MDAASLTFRLLGQGIAYSASPAMMAAAFADLGLPHRYVIADVDADGIESAVERLRDDDAGGANVTVPHKAAVAALVDELSEDAERAGAVNVVARDGRRLLGLNTDLPATVEAIRTIAPTGVEHAVVLGAGGAGRAAEIALRDTAAVRLPNSRRLPVATLHAQRGLVQMSSALRSVRRGGTASPFFGSRRRRPDTGISTVIISTGQPAASARSTSSMV